MEFDEKGFVVSKEKAINRKSPSPTGVESFQNEGHKDALFTFLNKAEVDLGIFGQALVARGFSSVNDLSEAPDAELVAIGFKNPEIRRLRRSLHSRADVGDKKQRWRLCGSYPQSSWFKL